MPFFLILLGLAGAAAASAPRKRMVAGPRKPAPPPQQPAASRFAPSWPATTGSYFPTPGYPFQPPQDWNQAWAAANAWQAAWNAAQQQQPDEPPLVIPATGGD